MITRSLGHRAPLLWLGLPLMLGICAGGLGIEAKPVALLASAALPIGWAIGVAGKHPTQWAVALVAGMTIAGCATYNLSRRRLPEWGNLPPREATLSLKIDRVFGQADPKKYSAIGTIVAAPSILSDLMGQRVQISGTVRPTEHAPIRSSIISVAGVITPLPRHPDANNFDSYLASAGVNFRMSRCRMVAVIRPARGYYRFCARAAARFDHILGVGVVSKRPAQVAVLRAMLLGRHHELSADQKASFRESGTMHLFSISGLHIAAIAGGLHAVLALLRLPRFLQLLAGLGTLWLYVDITGAAPSAVRAFVMVALVKCSLVLRVPSNPVSALAVSSLLVLLVRPLQLFSASFQMSYGIVASLILLGLPLGEAWHAAWTPFRQLPSATWRAWHHCAAAAWQYSASTVAIGVATSLVSAICGILFFELFTPGALLANLVLIPMATLVILGGFVSLLSGLLGFAVGSSLFNHASVLTLYAMDGLIKGFLHLPAMWLPARFASASTGAAMLALLIAMLILGYGCDWRRHVGGFWLPFAFLGLVLIFTVRFP